MPKKKGTTRKGDTRHTRYKDFLFQPANTKFNIENAYSLVYMSWLAYQTEYYQKKKCKQLGFKKFKYIEAAGSQAFVAGTDEYIIVAFRGTETLAIEDWLTDLKIFLSKDGYGSRVHSGFKIALSMIWAQIQGHVKEFRDNGQVVYLTGHSLGACLATIAAARLSKQKKFKIKINGVYTYASPRVGDNEFYRNYKKALGKVSYRIVNNNDIVTRMPPRVSGYRHVGKLQYIDEGGDIHADPSYWKRFVSTVKGYFVVPIHRFQEMQWGIMDGVGDHDVEDYLRIIQDKITNKFI